MKKIKAAVIGLGNIGLMYDFEPQRPHPSTHVFAYEESLAYELVCGIDEDKKKENYLREAAPNAVYFSSINEAIASGSLDGIGVVSICTPPSSHLSILKQMAEQQIGGILFCEKPIVSCVGEIKEVREIIKEHPNVLIIPNISRRWNRGLRKIQTAIDEERYGKLEKINIRYTRGINNTGSHLFDLLKMWTAGKISRVLALNETYTSAVPEQSYSFYFEQSNGVTGYAEAINDNNYYLFEVDLFFSNGKIEMRCSGNEVIYYKTSDHHLFDGFRELKEEKKEVNLLSEACLKNAVDNIVEVILRNRKPNCVVEDAVYPLYVAEAVRRSYETKRMEEVSL